MKIDTAGHWRMYWGPGPLPMNAEAIGTVSREPGDLGALLLVRSTGLYVQGNAGAVRSLPQRDIRAALHAASVTA